MRAFVITVAFLMGFANVLWAKDALRVVVDPWAPFGGEQLPNGGISLDVITTVLGRAGYEVETSIVPWERALDGTRDGTFDIVGNLFYLPELEEYLTYSAPFFDSQVQFLRRRGSDISITDLNSLRPYSIAVGAGYFYESNFDQAEDLNKVVVTTVVQGVRMVASGRVDLTLDSVDVLNYILAEEVPELAQELEILPGILATQQVHMAIRSNHPQRAQIREDFNRVLGEMRQEGLLDELLAKHRY